MREGSEVFRQIGLREAEAAVLELVPVGIAPPLRLAGADEDDEDGPTIVRSID